MTGDRLDVSPRAHGEILGRISLPDLDVEQHERERAARYAAGEGLY